MAESLNKNRPILNISAGIRRNKLYAYPREGDHPNLRKVRNAVKKIIRSSQQTTFFFNNEKLRILHIPNFEPQSLISVAAGLKPASIANQYWPNRSIQKCTFIDYSSIALSYVKGLLNENSEGDLVNYIAEAMKASKHGSPDTHSFVRKFLQTQIRDYFHGDFKQLKTGLSRLSGATYIHGNLVDKHQLILDQLDSTSRTLFWHSNVWTYRPQYFLNSPDQMDANYLTLGLKVSNKFNLFAWKHRQHSLMLIGRDFNNLSFVFTDGISPEYVGTENDYYLLTDQMVSERK
jgi:hypothetical protein